MPQAIIHGRNSFKSPQALIFFGGGEGGGGGARMYSRPLLGAIIAPNALSWVSKKNIFLEMS